MTLRLKVKGQGGAVNFGAACAPTAPTKVSKAENKQAFRDALNLFAERIRSKECVHVLMDVRARTARKVYGGGSLGSVQGAYGRNKLNGNGRLLLR